VKRKYNPQKIKQHWTYTIKEICEVYGTHSRTIQNWISKGGLNPIEGTRKPYLIHGTTLSAFLREKRVKNKCKLLPDEFYCTRCKTNRKSRPEDIKIITTGKKMGSDKLSGRRIGICEICGCPLHRFLTYRKDEQATVI